MGRLGRKKMAKKRMTKNAATDEEEDVLIYSGIEAPLRRYSPPDGPRGEGRPPLGRPSQGPRAAL